MPLNGYVRGHLAFMSRHLNKSLIVAASSLPISAVADAGIGNGIVIGPAIIYFLVLLAGSLPACLRWQGHSLEHRVALGVGAPALGIAAGTAAASLADDAAQLVLFFLVPIVPVAAAIAYVLAKLAQANYSESK